MKTKKIQGKTALAAALFVVAVFVITIKLMNPTPILISVDGGEAVSSQISGVFTSYDMILLIASSIILTISGMYLLFFDSDENNENSTGKPAGESVLEERKMKWKEISETLKNDEQKIYGAIIDSEGIINQSELAEKTGFSKSNISRVLDLLESKGFVERKRRGMGNIVLLK
ncbi:hypothetical protein BEH94_04620 [Candidatus Altiarchaeales archaeon WOR_SM1_SCG]|nr:hypothetical protein BEH94_04620 [Candidatus Altiarchaeales archaeon WOR_SM1_SCG]